MRVIFCLFIFVISLFAETYDFKILDSLPHSTKNFTQGLFFDGKELVETTGEYGESQIFRYNANHQITDSLNLPEKYFGEGSVAVGNEIFYLTWKAKKAFILNKKPFKIKGEFKIPTEGWGLTFWNDALLMSNGSDELLQIALGSFRVFKAIKVRDGARAIENLNELEVVKNTLFANIWYSDSIAVIDLPSGSVRGYIDLSKKARTVRQLSREAEVLNGIAFDGNYLWITGKNWPWIYKIELSTKLY